MSKVLLLPSAKLVAPELRSEFGAIPTAMIPLDSRPALAYIAEPYAARGYDVLVAVHEAAQLVTDYLRRNSLEARSIDVGATTSLGATVLNALDSLDPSVVEVIINFADTFVKDPLLDGNVICYRELGDLYRWTGFQFDAEGRITEIADKSADASADERLPVFVGVFRIQEPFRFRELLRASVRTPQDSDTDPFFRALAAYFNSLPRTQVHLQQVHDWRDFGHLDTYYETKRAFCLNQRFFNDVQVDADRGIVRKSSRNAQKLLDEVKWYLALPKSLQYLGPRIFDYGLKGAESFVEMEFYGYPALNDLYLFGNLDAGTWHRVLQVIEKAIDHMLEFRYQPADRHHLIRSMEEMYVQKTTARLQPILSDERFARFVSSEVIINGQPCLGLPDSLRLLPDIAERVGLLETDGFTVIHGDLCLSNILFDRRNSFVRLIDPRGAFGSVEVYGDFRYDLAKLSHSFEGDYDFFVNDLLDLEWCGRELVFAAHIDERHNAVKRVFRRWIESRWGEYYAQIKLIESLLFLSMAPLHADRPLAQQAFLGRGLELFTKAVESSLGSRVGAVA